MKRINLNKPDDLLGIKLMRGCNINKPFFSHTIDGFVGNLRTALTFLSREGMDKKLVSKPRLTKKELDSILTLPKRRIEKFDSALKNLLIERIRADEEICTELSKIYDKEKKYFGVFFVAEDENNRPFEDMSRYVKILNRLMIDSAMITMVFDTIHKKYKSTPSVKDVSRVFNKKNKKFNPAQPFVAKASAKISKEEIKEKPVKNFKKKLPWTKK